MTDTNPKIGTAEVSMVWWDDDRQYDVEVNLDIYADGQWATDRVYLFRGGAIETGRDLKARAQRFVEKQIARREVTPDNAPVVIDPKRLKALEEVAEIVCNNRNDPDHMAFLLDAAISRLEASRG